MELNNLWLYHNYILDRLRNNYLPCLDKNCKCHINAKRSDDKQKLLSDLYFGFLISGFNLDNKKQNNLCMRLMDFLT